MRRNSFVAVVLAAALVGGSESAVSQTSPQRRAGEGGKGKGKTGSNEGAADLDSFASFVSRKGLTSAVVPSTGEGVLAWVEYSRGTPNVFVARENDGFSAKPVTAYAGDAGFDISDLALVVDPDDGGNSIEVLYSLFPSTKTEPQNPAHTLTPPTSSIFRVQVSSSSSKVEQPPVATREGGASGQESELATPELLAADASISLSTFDGHSTGAIFTRYDPAFSSGGTTVLKTTASYIAGGSEGGQPNAGGETSLFRVRQGQIGSMALRPGHSDGTTFAFENDRGDHAFIGVYNEGSASLLWVDPSFDSDEQPVWSPDGSKLGFLRFLQPLADAKGQSPSNTQEGGRPFVVMVAEISNSSTTTTAGPAANNSGDLEVVSATVVYDGCTSGYLDPAMYGVHPLQWSDNEHLLVPCENSGFV